ncbi:MAG TPA: ABC transporter permease subunit [Gemmatimonadales bacterium]|nr:ABC transporter permease subunit [Gemmatimonadales bacterium]
MVEQIKTIGRAPQQGVGAPAWWVVCARELRDLWIGGKGPWLILLYTLLLAGYSFNLASSVEVKMMHVSEMIMEMVKASLAVGLLITMVIAADSISGERERRTFEQLLLSPATRRQILFGKLVAACSPWPLALAISIPYWQVMAKGDPAFGQAVLWAVVLGGMLVPMLAAVGLMVSIACNATKASMFVCLGLYLPMLMAAEPFRRAKVVTASEVAKGLALETANPMAAVHGFLAQVLVFNVPVRQMLPTLIPVLVFLVLALVLLFGYLGPRMSMEAETATRLRAFLAVFGVGRQPAAPAKKIAPRPAVPAVAETFSTPTAKPRVMRPRPVDASSGSSPWWVVLTKEMKDLWIGGRALNLTIAYTVLLGGYAYWMASYSLVGLIPPKEMVFELLKAALLAGVFMGLIVGADSLSGERERATLEALLVTPISRRQLVVAKFLAACSMWPVTFLITVPLFKVLAQGDEVFGQAVLWGGLFGIGLTGFTALGMVVSWRSNSNKTSMAIAIALFLLFVLPTQLPGNAQGSVIGLLGQAVNPLGAYRHFLAKVLVNNAHPAQVYANALAPFVFGVIMIGYLVLYVGSALNLDAVAPRRRRMAPAASVAAAILIAFGLSAFAAAPARAQGTDPLKVSISMTDSTLRAGGTILFQTTVTNTQAEQSAPVIVAMNIINLSKTGEVVDPEDWSPQRTQYVEPLAAGQSSTIDWRINAILDGNFMVYMVAIPAPTSKDATSQPVASGGIHLVVTPYTKLNPGGVLPFAVGGPLVLAVVIFFVYRHRRRQIDMGGAQ